MHIETNIKILNKHYFYNLKLHKVLFFLSFFVLPLFLIYQNFLFFIKICISLSYFSAGISRDKILVILASVYQRQNISYIGMGVVEKLNTYHLGITVLKSL